MGDIPRDQWEETYWEPKHCILGITDIVIQAKYLREAAERALFQAQRLILMHWISPDPPTVKKWLEQMGTMFQFEKSIFQHRGSPFKFEKVWGIWLSTPDLAPTDLIMERVLF